MTETIVVAGAGIAGLSAAMALAAPGRAVTVLDRDAAPPDSHPDEAFYEWERKGVTQLRHSHVFLGRLVKMIRTRHPALWTELEKAGTREFTFADALPPVLREKYAFQPGDEELSILFSRRTTLELIMRRYAASLPGVRFVPNAAIRGTIVEHTPAGPRVAGLRGEADGVGTEWRADNVIDATGRFTQMPEWLAAAGVQPAYEESPAGILYFTRHYRLRDGQDEPPRGEMPGAGDLGYIKYGVFPADNRHFSITLACPEIETELRTAINRPDIFDAICAALPGAGRWTETGRSEPVSKVFAMGNLKSVWRRYVRDGRPVVAGYYPVGDAILRTNPLYGRGCSTSAISAHILADVFAETADPSARLRAYEARVGEDIRPFWDAMVKQDLQAIKRAEQEQTPGHKSSIRARVIKSFLEDAIGPATRGDLTVLRALMRPFHMHENPTKWTKDPAIMMRIMRVWATPKAFKKHLYLPKLGPARAEMLRDLGLEKAA